MNEGNCCCGKAGSGCAPLPVETGGRDSRRRGFFRRGASISGWTVPGAVLVLLPKCPACLAAYIAIGTGIGISVGAATYLRTGLVAVCAGMLGYLAVVRTRRLIVRERA